MSPIIKYDPKEVCSEHNTRFEICQPAHETPHMYYLPPGHNSYDPTQRISELEREVGKWKSKYEQLEVIYNKLADQWNAFQALSKPDNRNIQRAEGAGEMARKLGEVLLCLAYDTDARPLIAKLLVTLADAQNPAGGQKVEVSGKLVKHRG